MKKFFAIICLLGCLTSCIRFFPASSMDMPSEPKMDIEPFVDVILRYSTELKYEKEITLMDSKVYYDDYVRRIRLDYEGQQIMELCEAREFIVDIVEGLTKKMNDNANARGQMIQNHVNYSDFDIYIKFTTFFTKYVDEMYVGWISLRHGTVSFYAGDTTDFDVEKWHCRTEPYSKSRLYVNVTRDAEKHYKETHPEPSEESQYFGKGEYAPINWFMR